MTSTALWAMSAVDQARGVRDGSWSSEELVRSVLDRIETANPAINAICTIAPDSVAQARRADHARYAGAELGPLHGVPFTVKDLIPTAGLLTTLGSLGSADWVPEYDELSVGRLRDAGGVLIGKTNTRELGYGVVTDNELFGATRNPWDLRMTPAGSSGGAAAAVAAGMGALAIGSDGGGSLRVPAAVCGVFAMKPTFGVVPMYPSSRAGLRTGLDSWESLECIGPITRTVADSALALSVMSGFDVRDRHSAPAGSVTFRSPEVSAARGLRVAFSADLGVAEVDPEIEELFRAAVEAVAADLGWVLREGSPDLAPLHELRATFAATVAMDTDRAALRELAATVSVSPDIRELVDHDWRAEDFDRARSERRRIYDAFERFGGDADVLITPATATPAFPIGLRFPPDGAPIADGRQWSPFAFLANLTSQPAVSIPIGRTRAGLPVGLQAIGARFADSMLLDIAAACEAVLPPAMSFA
jgi:aspartyl-tRNA(Asn)/glutamyl-tRNA(Gln) amidotransferase subunit A